VRGTDLAPKTVVVDLQLCGHQQGVFAKMGAFLGPVYIFFQIHPKKGGFGENKKSEVDLEKRPEKLILNLIKVISIKQY